mmetsp:Transcript_40193/g.47025  ORF Transcript_40193/g.47025 Transcript_40193/m.47025 type:complete len:82 (+) Transcript_40193:1107-1352(+)
MKTEFGLISCVASADNPKHPRKEKCSGRSDVQNWEIVHATKATNRAHCRRLSTLFLSMEGIIGVHGDISLCFMMVGFTCPD